MLDYCLTQAFPGPKRDIATESQVQILVININVKVLSFHNLYILDRFLYQGTSITLDKEN